MLSTWKSRLLKPSQTAPAITFTKAPQALTTAYPSPHLCALECEHMSQHRAHHGQAWVGSGQTPRVVIRHCRGHVPAELSLLSLSLSIHSARARSKASWWPGTGRSLGMEWEHEEKEQEEAAREGMLLLIAGTRDLNSD